MENADSERFQERLNLDLIETEAMSSHLEIRKDGEDLYSAKVTPIRTSQRLGK
jgi:hypothetical protein